MKRIILPILLLLSLFLLVSCAKEETAAGGGAFIGGSEGIVASFEPLSIEEDGIYTVFDTEDFSLDIVLKNKGEEDVPAGKARLKLLGPSKTSFTNIPSWELANRQLIEKISEFNPEGGEEIISFTPTNRAMYTGEVTGYQDLVWNLEFDYDYKTYLIIDNVCFKGDITDERVCELKEPKTFSISGAPITVNSVVEDSAGRGLIMLKIIISDVGEGDSTIVGQEFDHRFDQVAYTIDEPDKWECKSGGRTNEARLIEGTAQIICRLKAPLIEDDLYTKPVRLTLAYTYRDLIQEKLRIKESVR